MCREFAPPALCGLLVLILASLPGCGGDATVDDGEHRLLILGQDLGAIRGYMASDCCPVPDGMTAYLDFYDLLKPGDFGGLGVDADGKPIDLELSWGSGPNSAWKTATEFGVDGLAIGLSITENEHPGKLTGLANGEYDAEIDQLGRFFGMIPGPVYLRIGYEFDGAWNVGYDDADNYKAAWIRIVDRLRAGGADNVEFVWQGAASVVDEVIDRGQDDITRWYPGDDYVDWMSISWFMNPDEEISAPSPAYIPRTVRQLSDEMLAFARARGKPVMIAEASPQAMDLRERFMADHVAIWDGAPGENRVEMTDAEMWDYWFAPLFDYMSANDDVIEALAYINADWDSQPMWGPPYNSGFWGDTRLEVNELIAERFSAAVDAWRGETAR